MNHTCDLSALPGLSKEVRAMGLKHMDADTVALELRNALQREKRVLYFYIAVGVAFCLYCAFGFDVPTTAAGPKAIVQVFAARIIGMLLAIFILALIYSVTADDETSSLLRPIADTEMCSAAAELVLYPRPGVLEWRDQAILERGQLHNFDIEIMAEIKEQFDATKEQLAAANKRAEDCRIAHGVITVN